MNKRVLSFVLALTSTPGFASSLTVVSYGGSLATAQIEAAHKPFGKATDVRVISEDYSGGIAQIKTQVDSQKITWDVVDADRDGNP